MAETNPWAQLRLTFDERDTRKPTGKLKFVEKLWGHEQWLQDDGGAQAGYCGKILTLFRGYKTSLHYHPKKHETMLVTEGELELQLQNPTLYVQGTNTYVQGTATPCNADPVYDFHTLKPGDKIEIPPGVAHRMVCASKDIPYTELIEFSTPHSDDDVVRIEPSDVEVF